MGGRAQFACRLPDQREAIVRGAIQVAAGVGQKDPAAAPFEQRNAQVLLDGAHGAADSAMRQMEFVGGPTEILQPRRGLEAAQGHQRRHAQGRGP